MNENEKLELIADVLEIPEETINPDLVLEEIENWDSMMIMKLVVLMNEKGFTVKLNAELVESLKKVSDILNIME